MEWMINSLIRLFTTITPDFQVLFLGAKDLISSNNPYINQYLFTGNTNPPSTLLFYIPLSFVDYLTAQNIFTLISILCMCLCVVLSFKIIDSKLNVLTFISSLFLVIIAFPTKFNFGMGQSNFVTFLLLLLSYYFFKNKKIYMGGIFLGLLISYKLIFAYVLLFFLSKKQWKILIVALLVFLIAAGAIYCVTGSFDLYRFYFSQVIPPLFNFEGREIYYNQGISSFVSRLVSNIEWRRAISFALSIVFIVANWLKLRKNKNIDSQFSLTILTLLLVDTFSWQHHFILLIFPFLLLWKSLGKNRINIFLIGLSYLLVSLNLPEYLFSSNLFFGTLILYYLNWRLIL